MFGFSHTRQGKIDNTTLRRACERYDGSGCSQDVPQTYCYAIKLDDFAFLGLEFCDSKRSWSLYGADLIHAEDPWLASLCCILSET